MIVRLALRRLVLMVPVLFIVSLMVFMMVHLTPGDPVRAMLGRSGASAEEVENIRQQLGLNDPLPLQYVHFMTDLATGELKSIRTQQPVVQEFFDRFPRTLELAVLALIVATVLGFVLGIIAATHQNSWIDSLTMVVSLLGVSVPGFWLALLLIFIFAISLDWLPATGTEGVRSLILPVTVLAVEQIALIARLVRANMVEVLRDDYIRTARAKGLRERAVLTGHALRNALLPSITLLGLNFGYLLSGAVIVEMIFARPGIGRLIVEAILSRDFPLVQGAVLLTAVVYLIVNLITDISYGIVDPRVRH
ncbi:MAG: ABC transporter permease [Thermomicrobiales bacterium]|nr:ABC transporter permease [Thermomicrobiales bacterium]